MDISHIVPAGVLNWYSDRGERGRDALEVLFNICMGAGVGLTIHQVLDCGRFWEVEWSAAAGSLGATLLWANRIGLKIGRAHRRLGDRGVEALDLAVPQEKKIQTKELRSSIPATFPLIPHLDEGSCWFAATLVSLAPLLLLPQFRDRLLPEDCDLQEGLAPLFAHLLSTQAAFDPREIRKGFRLLLDWLSRHGDNRSYTIHDPTEAFNLIVDKLGLAEHIGFTPVYEVTFSNYLPPLMYNAEALPILNLNVETHSVVGNPTIKEPFSFRHKGSPTPLLRVELNANSLQEAVERALIGEIPSRHCLAQVGDRYFLTESTAEQRLIVQSGPTLLPIIVERFDRDRNYRSQKLHARCRLTLSTEEEGEVHYQLAAFTCFGLGHHWAHLWWREAWQRVDDYPSVNVDEGFNPSELDTGYFYLYVRKDVWKERTQIN